jgi:hypothetical protein
MLDIVLHSLGKIIGNIYNLLRIFLLNIIKPIDKTNIIKIKLNINWLIKKKMMLIEAYIYIYNNNFIKILIP